MKLHSGLSVDEWVGRWATPLFSPGDSRRARTVRSGTWMVCAMLLALLGSGVLVAFLRPTIEHAGLNGNERSRFMDMVEGTAHRPFVYRALLPSLIRVASALAPERLHTGCAEAVENQRLLRLAFAVFEWETPAAFEYGVAILILYASLIGFACCFAGLANQTCRLKRSPLASLGLAAVALLLLPPFFQYTSYLYDPPQLFLFTLALLLLAQGRRRPFFGVFLLCSLNKETAVLLIPLYGLVHFRRQLGGQGQVMGDLIVLTGMYLTVKLFLTWAFRGNPGSVVEFQLARNLRYFVNGWTFADLAVFLVLIGLTFTGWAEKSLFLQNAFWVVVPPLAALAFFLGFMDEWRGYYEALPIVFCLCLDSIQRIRRVLRQAPVPGFP